MPVHLEGVTAQISGTKEVRWQHLVLKQMALHSALGPWRIQNQVALFGLVTMQLILRGFISGISMTSHL